MPFADPLALDSSLDFSVHPWGGPASPLVRTAFAAIPERRGYVVRVRDREGHVGLGEATPLPALFPEDSLEVTHRALGFASERQRPASLSANDLSAWICKLPEQARAVRFAFESAFIDLRAKRKRTDIASELTRTPREEIALARVVGALSANDLDVRVAEAVRAGYTTIKVKLGPGDVPGARWNLERLRTIASGRVRLRVDCNGSLEPEAFLRVVPSLIRADVELVEEPCAPEGLDAALTTGLPVYLDESFLRNPMAALATRGIAGVVLKPTLFEAPTTCLRLAASAASRGLGVILSHAFEGPIALAMAREMAMALPGDQTHGLDDHAALEIFSITAPKLEPTFRRSREGELARRGGLQVMDPTSGLERELSWTA